MNGELTLLLRLAAAQLLLQPVLSLLARGLGRRLPWRIVGASLALPWLLLAPWIFSSTILVPTGVLANQVPGLEPAQLDAHSIQLNDSVLAFLPWELEVRHALSAGRLPLWSDLLDGGSSPWANPQAAVLSPLTLPARLAPIQHHLLFALALRIGVAFQGTWLAARAFGARRAGAAIAGAAYALGGGMLAWALFSHSAAIAWASWTVGAAITVVRRPSRSRFTSTALVFLVLLLAGQPELALGAGALAALLALPLARRGDRVRAIGALLAAGALGAGLAAAVVVPFLAAVPGSQREHDLRDPAAHGAALGGVALASARSWLPRHPHLLRGPLTPWAFGAPYAPSIKIRVEPIHAYASYAGLASIAGVAVLLLTLAAPRRVWIPLAAATLVYLLFAEVPALVALWSRLPVLRLLVFTRLLPLCGLCLALVGALGIDRLLRHPNRAPVATVLASVFAVLSSLSLLAGSPPSKSVAAVGALFVAGAIFARRAPRLAVGLLLLGLVVDQVRWGRHLLPRGAPERFYPRTPEVARLVELAGGEGGRAVGHDFLVHPNVLAVYGLSDPRVNNPLVPHRYLETLGPPFDYRPSARRYFSHFLAPEHPFLDFLGVRAVYSNVNLPPIPEMERVSLPGGIFFVARNADALPRWFLAERFDRVADDGFEAWLNELDDPARVAVAPDANLPESGLAIGTVELLDRSPGRVALALPRSGAKLLATSLPGPRGWRVRSASGELPPLEVNRAFLGAIVPDGVDRVELVYRPPGLGAGLAISALAAAALALLAVRPRARPGRLARPGGANRITSA